jgi:cell division protein FtsA
MERTEARSARRSSRPSGSPAPISTRCSSAFSAGGLVSDVASVEVEIGGAPDRGAGHRPAARRRPRQSIDPQGKMILHAHAGALHAGRAAGREEAARPPRRQAGRRHPRRRRRASPVKNLDLCVRSAHLGVEAIVASPVAAGKACLSEEERELGVAWSSSAAGVTNVSVFAGGMLVGLKSLPMGGIDITDDIASAFGTRRAEAERMKCFYGSATTSPRDNHDMIELAPIAGGEDGTEASRITRAQLIAVIRQRLEHLTGEIATALKELGFSGPVRAPGGADRRRIGAEGHRRLCAGRARPRRPHRPAEDAGLPEAHSGPGFTTLAGLAQFAASNELDLGRSRRSPPRNAKSRRAETSCSG